MFLPEELLSIPRFHYDFQGANFAVSDSVNPATGEKDVYWVDRDMIDQIIETGYVVPDDERRKIFEEGKKVLKI